MNLSSQLIKSSGKNRIFAPIIIISLFVLLSYLAIMPAYAVGTNLLTANQANGGEDGTTTGFSGWSDATVAVNNTMFYNGNHSIMGTCVSGKANGPMANVPEFSAVNGHTYSGSARVLVPEGVLFQIQVNTGAPNWEGVSVTYTGTGKWQYVNASMTATSDSSLGASAYIGVWTQDPYEATTIFVDELTFYDGAPTAIITASLNTVTLSANEGTDTSLTVDLSGASNSPVRVDYNITQGTAIAGTDYSLNDDPGAVVCYGDSIMAGVLSTHNGINGVGGYIKDVKPGYTVINKGVGGRMLKDLVGNFSADVLAYNPKYLVLNGGTNDASDANLTWVQNNITALYQLCYTHNITLILCNIPPTDAFNGNVETWRNNVNSWEETYCTANGIGYIDLSEILTDPAQTSPGRILTAYTYDGTHLTDAGYAAWGANIPASYFPAKTLVFSAGQTSKTVAIHLLDDKTLTGDKTFTVTLSSPVNATLGTNTVATITIIDSGSGANVDKATQLMNMTWLLIVVVAVVVVLTFLSALVVAVRNGNMSPTMMVLLVAAGIMIGAMVITLVVFNYVSGEIITALRVFGG